MNPRRRTSDLGRIALAALALASGGLAIAATGGYGAPLTHPNLKIPAAVETRAIDGINVFYSDASKQPETITRSDPFKRVDSTLLTLALGERVISLDAYDGKLVFVTTDAPGPLESGNKPPAQNATFHTRVIVMDERGRDVRELVGADFVAGPGGLECGAEVAHVRALDRGGVMVEFQNHARSIATGADCPPVIGAGGATVLQRIDSSGATTTLYDARHADPGPDDEGTRNYFVTRDGRRLVVRTSKLITFRDLAAHVAWQWAPDKHLHFRDMQLGANGEMIIDESDIPNRSDYEYLAVFPRFGSRVGSYRLWTASKKHPFKYAWFCGRRILADHLNQGSHKDSDGIEQYTLGGRFVRVVIRDSHGNEPEWPSCSSTRLLIDDPEADSHNDSFFVRLSN